MLLWCKVLYNIKYYYVDYENSGFEGWASDRGESFYISEKKGAWKKYSEISNYGTDAYVFNLSQYGPLLEY